MSLASFLTDTVAPNLGTTWPDFLLIIILAALIIAFALGLRLGLLISFVTLALTYVFFSNIGLVTRNVLVVLMAVAVLLFLSLFVSNSRQQSGVIG